MRRLFLFLAPLALVACASEEEKIQNRIALEIEACKAATGEFYEVPYEVGDPYKMYRTFCDQPVADVKLVDPVRATAKVGPYEFQLNKNLKEGRWGLALVRWEALDSARNTLGIDNLTEADYKAAEEQLAKAETEGPTVAEIKLKRLEVLIALRKKANKTQETMADRASLGPVAEGYYKQATAAAREQSNPDLEARRPAPPRSRRPSTSLARSRRWRTTPRTPRPRKTRRPTTRSRPRSSFARRSLRRTRSSAKSRPSGCPSSRWSSRSGNAPSSRARAG
jgi:hypothetical protein